MTIPQLLWCCCRETSLRSLCSRFQCSINLRTGRLLWEWLVPLWLALSVIATHSNTLWPTHVHVQWDVRVHTCTQVWPSSYLTQHIGGPHLMPTVQFACKFRPAISPTPLCCSALCSSIGIYLDTVNIFIRILSLMASSSGNRRRWAGDHTPPPSSPLSLRDPVTLVCTHRLYTVSYIVCMYSHNYIMCTDEMQGIFGTCTCRLDVCACAYIYIYMPRQLSAIVHHMYNIVPVSSALHCTVYVCVYIVLYYNMRDVAIIVIKEIECMGDHQHACSICDVRACVCVHIMHILYNICTVHVHVCILCMYMYVCM